MDTSRETRLSGRRGLRAVASALAAATLLTATAQALNAQVPGGRPASGGAPQAAGFHRDGLDRRIPRGVLGGLPTTAADSTVATIVRRLDFDHYKSLVAGLADFGDREQGTERNARAVDWIEVQLESWGYETERLRYEYRGEPREEVYATKVGSTSPNEMYILGGHMDGRGAGQAANDDASGAALVMEIARVLASPDIRTDRSVRFALWNNEETGLEGAEVYVDQRAALQGVEDPLGSGRYPEPTWLGMIQHDKVLFDRGNPVQDEQALNADVDI